jgi:hypothetical protein
MLEPWSDRERKAFIARIAEDSRRLSAPDRELRVTVKDVAGWRIANGLSIYYLDTVSSSTMPAGMSTISSPPDESAACEVGGFGSHYEDYLSRSASAVSLPNWMHISDNNVWLEFIYPDGRPHYFASVSGPNMKDAIRRVIGERRSEPTIYMTNPPYGVVAPNAEGWNERILTKDQMDSILRAGDSFGFSVTQP